MKTKLEAAKILPNSGCVMAIANGFKTTLKNIDKKYNCTWFLPKISKLHEEKT